MTTENPQPAAPQQITAEQYGEAVNTIERMYAQQIARVDGDYQAAIHLIGASRTVQMTAAQQLRAQRIAELERLFEQSGGKLKDA